MPRLPRFSPQSIVVCALMGGLALASGPLAWGQETQPATPPAPTTGPAAPATPAVTPPESTTPAPVSPVDKAVLQAAEEFWHFASMGQYAAAKVIGEKLGAADAAQVLSALEAVVELRNRYLPAAQRVDMDSKLLQWQRIPELKDVSKTLMAKIAEARKARALDLPFIEQSISLLGGTRNAYLRAVDRLKQSGEMAVPLMIAALRDANRRDLRGPIRSALRDMGDDVIRPLLAATEMKDAEALPWVIAALGDLGRKASLPYLARLANSKDQPESIRTAATQTLMRMGIAAPELLNPTQLFFDQAEECYYGKSSLSPRDPKLPGHMWYWRDNTLDYRDVPVPVLLDHMAMRSCEYVLSLDPARGDAVSLWLAAAYKREVDMPEGGADKAWDDQHPKAHYYAVAAGTQYLNAVLARALRDHDAAVAMKSIKSLQDIVGGANLFTAEQNRPVLSAMRYGDRRVRFEAAMTIAQSLPQKPFMGQELVIPILCEAIAQTGKAGVLVVSTSQDDLNKKLEPLNKAGAYIAKGGTSVEGALAASLAMPGVDVIVVGESHPQQVEALFAQMRGNLRLERAAVLVLVASKEASSFAREARNDTQITLAQPKDDAELIAAIEEARKRAGILTLDEKLAVEYAVRSADLLARLAIGRGQVLDLNGALSTLMAALDDARPEIVKAAGNALGNINGNNVQAALATKALDEKTPDEIKISIFKSLATNAKAFGNLLEAAQQDALTKFVETAANLDVRSAAAEAHGALNLRPDQVKKLILQQKK